MPQLRFAGVAINRRRSPSPAGGRAVRTCTYRLRAPMARPTTVFTCSSCGHEEPKWHGRCSGCGEWNTLAEEARAPALRGGGGAARPAGSRAARPVRLADVEAVKLARLRTGIGELDRVLGGGLVPGSLVLLGGSPGIGKSTLTSMAMGNLAGAGRR